MKEKLPKDEGFFSKSYFRMYIFLIWMFGRGFFPVRLFFLVCDADGVLTQTDDMPNGMFLFTKHYG